MVILSACCQFLQLTNHCNLKKKKREYRLTEKDHSIFHQCPIKSLSKIHFCHYNLWSPFKNRMPDQNLFKLFALRARSSATITCLQLQQCHFTPAQIHTSNMLNLLSSLYLLFIPWNKILITLYEGGWTIKQLAQRVPKGDKICGLILHKERNTICNRVCFTLVSQRNPAISAVDVPAQHNVFF